MDTEQWERVRRKVLVDGRKINLQVEWIGAVVDGERYIARRQRHTARRRWTSATRGWEPQEAPVLCDEPALQ